MLLVHPYGTTVSNIILRIRNINLEVHILRELARSYTAEVQYSKLNHEAAIATKRDTCIELNSLCVSRYDGADHMVCVRNSPAVYSYYIE